MSRFHKVSTENVEFLRNASKEVLVHFYEKLLTKRGMACQHIWFNQECLRRNIIPNYAQHIYCRSTSRECKLAIQRAKKIWMKLEIKKWFRIRDNICVYLKILHSKLTEILHQLEFDIIDNVIRERVSEIKHDAFIRQSRKLNNLQNLQNGDEFDINLDNTHAFSDRFVNLSNVNLNNREINYLEKGLKFCKKPKFTTEIKSVMASEAESALRLSNLQYAKFQIADLIRNSKPDKNSNSDYETERSIKNKITNNDLVLAKADKGNSSVLLTKNSYNGKITDFINSNNLATMNNNPTSRYNTKIKNALDKTKLVFNNETKNTLIVKNPQAPKLYGTIKIHKQDKPIKPVDSDIGVTCVKLSRKLN